MSVFQMPKFLLFGDSITEYAYNQYPLTAEEIQKANKAGMFDGDNPEKSHLQETKTLCFSMAAKLNDDYRRKMQIVQRGYSGYNSDQAVKIARAMLAREHDGVPVEEQFKLAYVFFGTNDYRLTTPETGYMEGVPLERFETNMAQIMDMFKQRGIKTIIVTPGLHDDVLWDKCWPEDLATKTYRTNERAIIYGNTLKALAAERSFPIIDMYAIMVEYVETHMEGDLKAVEHGGLGTLLIDGIHFTGLAYRLFYDALVSTIATNWPQLSASSLGDKFPHWSELSRDFTPSAWDI